MKLLLWDIDGTLLTSGRAGERAMRAAFLDTFGIPNGLDTVDFAGRTDSWILQQGCALHKLPHTEENAARFFASYLGHLAREINNPAARLLAGVLPLVQNFHDDERVTQGLLTGNLRDGAQIKLRHFDIWQFMHFGAFADDSPLRNELGPFALRRASTHLGYEADPKNTFIIGDTPHDIACARAIGARAVAVATGNFSADALKAHEPDLVLSDLSAPEPLCEFLFRN